ncbi:selenium metabolism protein YedF [Olsenella profusa DSM 13989]|uniref:Selenium metabolism protein YedF n=1 Tax=Olsenella profusa F0195 TaxID=1125712 RepID=U2TL83_9ACTN|nr:sulfurtransferase-like selenium metabolism protein YedF [Olsenella profusa]ERL07205.1 selenium metabolism protein YedF [Olsenella profusa F0195]MDP9860198.1 selenium metabolism protein YedF [Olsenella profusa DSM 13989]
MAQKISVDAMGKECPIPVVMTLKAMKGLTEATTVETMVDNRTAVGNLQRLAEEKGCTCSVEGDDGAFTVSIEVPEGGISEGDDQAFVASCTPQRKNVVVQIASDTMGIGADDLGKQLLKGFIYALAQLDDPPATVLLYNGGAHVSCEGSDSLEDLKALEDRGTEILTCGTCLDHYGIADKLKVGGVTNMYTITEKLAQASLIIRP